MPAGTADAERERAALAHLCELLPDIRAASTGRPPEYQRLLTAIEAAARARTPVADLLDELYRFDARRRLPPDAPRDAVRSRSRRPGDRSLPGRCLLTYRAPATGRAVATLPPDRGADADTGHRMTTFFDELAKKLAERWVSLLAIPGLLFLTAILLGARLRWAHALDVAYALDSLDNLVADLSRWPAARTALCVAGVLLAAAAVGLAAGGLAAGIRLIWLGRW